MAKEGEESQEDNSKIRSVENFPVAQMWILICFVLSTTFHVNPSWENAKTHKLDEHAEQPISCAEGENSTKNWKFEHDSIRWYFHVGSWINMFQSNVRYIS